MNQQPQQFDTDGGTATASFLTREDAQSAVRNGLDGFGNGFGVTLGAGAAAALLTAIAYVASVVVLTCSNTDSGKK